MGIARIGTSGYSYDDWRGVLYPPECRKSDYLEIYAQEFDLAELNFTYYRMPEAKLTKRMVEQTGSGFLFSVKAHQAITHKIDNTLIGNDINEFVKGIGPIINAGKLGVVLLQFPFSFHYTPQNRLSLDRICSGFGTIPLAIEFRNNGWEHESVLDGLRKRNIATVNVDEPDLAGLMKLQAQVTSKQFGYVRFHGRNKENWWGGDNVTRYDYSYNDNELKEWIERIRPMLVQTAVVLIVFNNHSKGQAVQNARRLKMMLEEESG